MVLKELLDETQLKRNTSNGRYVGTTIFYKVANQVRNKYKKMGYKVKIISTHNKKRFGTRQSIYRIYLKD